MRNVLFDSVPLKKKIYIYIKWWVSTCFGLAALTESARYSWGHIRSSRNIRLLNVDHNIYPILKISRVHSLKLVFQYIVVVLFSKVFCCWTVISLSSSLVKVGWGDSIHKNHTAGLHSLCTVQLVKTFQLSPPSVSSFWTPFLCSLHPTCLVSPLSPLPLCCAHFSCPLLPCRQSFPFSPEQHGLEERDQQVVL